jgi:hypothetical protein
MKSLEIMDIKTREIKQIRDERGPKRSVGTRIQDETGLQNGLHMLFFKTEPM